MNTRKKPGFLELSSFKVKKQAPEKYKNIVADTGSIHVIQNYGLSDIIPDVSVGNYNPGNVVPAEYSVISESYPPAMVNNTTSVVATNPQTSTSTPVGVSVLPNLTQYNCGEITAFIAQLRESLTTIKNEAALRDVQAAITYAENEYIKRGCAGNPINTGEPDVLPVDKPKTGNGQTPAGSVSLFGSDNKIPTWLWVAGGALVVIVALK